MSVQALSVLIVVLLVVLLLVILLLAFKPRVVSEVHALYEAGALTEQHVIDYFEAKIATEKASAASMLAHAEAATASLSVDAVKAVTSVADSAAAKV